MDEKQSYSERYDSKIIYYAYDKETSNILTISDEGEVFCFVIEQDGISQVKMSKEHAKHLISSLVNNL